MSYADDRCLRPKQSLKGLEFLRENPINVFVRLSVAEGYENERVDLNELHIALNGLWCDHNVSITWNSALEQLQIFLIFESRTIGGRSNNICRLISLLNERLVSGHFDYWDKNKSLVYRDSISLRGGANLKIEQAMDMIALALDAAERGYPACQYVLWAGKSPEDALTSALVDLESNK